jgi:hypothetical protein
MQKLKLIEPILIENIPVNKFSIAQEYTYQKCLDSNITFLMWSRQIGKSNLLSGTFWKRIIDTSKVGQLYITMSPTEGDVKDLMIDDILLEAFGGKDTIYDLNAIFITPPTEWWDYMSYSFQKDYGLYKYWQDNNWLIMSEGTPYVKLFIRDLSNSGRGKKSQLHYTGKLFTGADILCVAANHNLNKTVRGRKIKGVYGEEMGEYPKDPFGAILPSVLKQNGWMMYAGTPNETNPLNWTYEKYTEVINSPYVEKERQYGIDFYTSAVALEVPISAEDLLDGSVGEQQTVTQKTTWAIGDLENIFPYVYQGNISFANIQASRKNPHKVVYHLDSQNKPIKDAKGNLLFDIVPTGIPNPSGLLTDEQYEREFRVRFNAGDVTVFKDFSDEINVIDHTLFKPERYNCIAGYDHGTADENDLANIKQEGRISASAYAKVACIPIMGTDEYQYVIYDGGYISDPTLTDISSTWHNLLLEGMPIIAENALWKKTIKGVKSDFMEILESNKYLLQDPRSYTGRGIFKCHKRVAQKKIPDLNKWFREDKFLPHGRINPTKYIHPVDITKTGRKIFITSNCQDLIRFFKTCTLVVNKKGEKVEKKIRNDIYDAATYVIDFMEYRKDLTRDIKKYWELNKTWPVPQAENTEDYEWLRRQTYRPNSQFDNQTW